MRARTAGSMSSAVGASGSGTGSAAGSARRLGQFWLFGFLVGRCLQGRGDGLVSLHAGDFRVTRLQVPRVGIRCY